MHLNIIKYLNFKPKIAKKVKIHQTSWIIGNTSINKNTIIEDNVVIRGDGDKISIGEDCIIQKYSTVHVASDFLGTSIGDRCIIGKGSVIHACKLGQDIIVGENAVVMDGSLVENNSIITADTLISPGKKFPPFSLISGSPGKIVRKLNNYDFNKIKNRSLQKNKDIFLSKNNFRMIKRYSSKYTRLPYLELPYLEKGLASENIFIAPDAILTSKLVMEDLSSIWFSVSILSDKQEGNCSVGMGSNIQDNSIINTKSKKCSIGARVTIGHNVIINGPIKIEDDAVIGMGSFIEEGCIIKKNAFVGANSYLSRETVVPEKKIFAGNPAKYFRDVRSDEELYFKRGQKIYEELTKKYCDFLIKH